MQVLQEKQNFLGGHVYIQAVVLLSSDDVMAEVLH